MKLRPNGDLTQKEIYRKKLSKREGEKKQHKRLSGSTEKINHSQILLCFILHLVNPRKEEKINTSGELGFENNLKENTELLYKQSN